MDAIRPFIKVGCDYAGPIVMKQHSGRCKKYVKGYIAVFICMNTKAIHLELVSDLTTEAFVAALKRFISRRGIPSDIFSDNGTNFVGAKRSLSEMHEVVLNSQHNTKVSLFLASSSIQWHFIPPSAPHFGGLWEAGVKSTKFHLKRVIGCTTLTYEELNTLLAQIEGVLNSRPLSVITESSADPLTPAHFLIGQPINMLPEVGLLDVPMNRLNRWQTIQAMVQSFWKRWSVEYLTSLNPRKKWNKEKINLQPNQIVIIRESNTQPSQWMMGRIIKCFPGADGLARVATVKTQHGELKRPITKLIPLYPEP